MVEDKFKDNAQDNPKAKAFIQYLICFEKLDDMAYLMDNPEGLEGTREVSQIEKLGYIQKAMIMLLKLKF